MAKNKDDETTKDETKPKPIGAGIEAKPIAFDVANPPPADEPLDDEPPHNAERERHPFESLTMRDAFAAVAMTSMELRGMAAEGVAFRCYEIADQMLAARLK